MIRVKVKVQGPQFLWISVTIHFKKNVHCPNFHLIHASWTQNWIANCKSRNMKFLKNVRSHISAEKLSVIMKGYTYYRHDKCTSVLKCL